MRYIDEDRLETDIEYRYAYVAEFLGFTAKDAEVIHGVAEQLVPLIPAIVDSVYERFHQYDATWRHFLSHQSGRQDTRGSIERRMKELKLDHAQIKTKKNQLSRYFKMIMTQPYDRSMVLYLDAMGRVHRGGRNSTRTDVPLVQMNAFMGFISDALTTAILGLNLAPDQSLAVVRAFNKVMWLQNDLISRYYQADDNAADEEFDY